LDITLELLIDTFLAGMRALNAEGGKLS